MPHVQLGRRRPIKIGTEATPTCRTPGVQPNALAHDKLILDLHEPRTRICMLRTTGGGVKHTLLGRYSVFLCLLVCVLTMGLKGQKPCHARARAPVHSQPHRRSTPHLGADARLRLIHRRVANRDAAVAAEDNVSAECGKSSPHRSDSLHNFAF